MVGVGGSLPGAGGTQGGNAGAVGWRGEHFGGGGDPGGEICWRGETAFPRGVNDFCDATHTSGHDGQSAGLGFENHIWKPLIATGHGEQAGTPHPGCHLGRSLGAKEVDAVGDSEAGSLRVQFLSQRAFASENEMRRFVAWASGQLGKGVEQEGRVFDGQKVADEEQDGRLGGQRGRRGLGERAVGIEDAGVDAVDDGMQSGGVGTGCGELGGETAAAGDAGWGLSQSPQDGAAAKRGAQVGMDIAALREQDAVCEWPGGNRLRSRAGIGEEPTGQEAVPGESGAQSVERAAQGSGHEAMIRDATDFGQVGDGQVKWLKERVLRARLASGPSLDSWQPGSWRNDADVPAMVLPQRVKHGDVVQTSVGLGGVWKKIGDEKQAHGWGVAV